MDILEKFFGFLIQEKSLKKRSAEEYLIQIKRCYDVHGDILQIKTYSQFSDLVCEVKARFEHSQLTTYKIASMLRVYFNWAEREELIEDSPVRLGHEFKKGKSKEPDFFDRADPADKAIIDKCLYYPEHSLKHRALLWLVYATGIRRAEVCALNYPEDIDLEKRFVHVRQTAGKGDKWRYVPFDVETAGVLKLYCKSLGVFYGGKSMPLFRSERGGRLTPHAVYRFYQHLKERLHLPVSVNPHKWRHSLAGYLIGTKKMDVTIASKILGHSSINTTLQYTNYKPETIKNFYDQATDTA